MHLAAARRYAKWILYQDRLGQQQQRKQEAVTRKEERAREATAIEQAERQRLLADPEALMRQLLDALWGDEDKAMQAYLRMLEGDSYKVALSIGRRTWSKPGQLSLDTPVGDEGETTLGAFVAGHLGIHALLCWDCEASSEIDADGLCQECAGKWLMNREAAEAGLTVKHHQPTGKRKGVEDTLTKDMLGLDEFSFGGTVRERNVAKRKRRAMMGTRIAGVNSLMRAS